MFYIHTYDFFIYRITAMCVNLTGILNLEYVTVTLVNEIIGLFSGPYPGGQVGLSPYWDS